MSAAPLIGLLTDFGMRDSYVAQMKGVIHSLCDATVVDLSHEIAPFDVFGAGIFLREAAPRFEAIVRRPVILVAVIDPGVGSSRRIIAAESAGRVLLAPDNGLLSVALAGSTARFVDVVNERFFLPGGSVTFHGRDRFAPVAAAIARGVAFDELGPAIESEQIVDLGYRAPDYEKEPVTGQVVRIDRFGNVVTDLDVGKAGSFASLDVRQVQISDRASTYAERSGSSEPFVIEGAQGTLEISVANGSAATALGASVRDPVIVSR